jgi:excisionase family DNA binding protein
LLSKRRNNPGILRLFPASKIIFPIKAGLIQKIFWALLTTAGSHFMLRINGNKGMWSALHTRLDDNFMQYDFEPLIPTEEAASLLGIHVKTLQLMAREGRIPGKRIGKFWRFRKSELDTWLREGINYKRYAYRPSKENQA